MRHLLLLFALATASQAMGQFSGNIAYRERRGAANEYALDKYIQATDSTVTISVNLLLNEKATRYKLTLGVRAQGKSSVEALHKINKRIDNFLKQIHPFAKEEDTFVDFISQNKTYDFEINEEKKTAQQQASGIEVRKNVIISLSNYKNIENIILKASEFDIYDVIKVDYINEDVPKTEAYLLKEAYALLEQKKKDYFSKFKREIIGEPNVSIDFHLYTPKKLYEKYTSSQSSSFDDEYGRYKKIYLPKEDTFYYEGIEDTGFDKVIDAKNPQVGIQYVFTLRAKYDIKKNK